MTASSTIVLLLSLLFSSALGFIAPFPQHKAQRCRPLYGDFFGDEEEEQDMTSSEDEEPVNLLSLEELEASAPEWAGHVPKYTRITLVGRIGNDPDPRYFDNGKVVLNLGLAVRRKYHPLERRALKITEDETDWFNLELWGRDAEYAAKYVTKGARVGVSGSMAVDSWEDRETGAKRSKCTVIVKDLDILESKAEAELRRGNQQQGGFQQGQRQNFYTEDDDDDDDDDDSDMFPSPSSAGTGGFFS